MRKVARSSLKLLFYALSFGWILYVYHRNLPHINTAVFKEFIKLRDFGCFDIALVLCLWAAAYLIGARLIEFLGAPLESGIERLSLASATGFAIISLEVLLLAATHLLYRVAAWTLLVLPLVWWSKRLKKIPDEVWTERYRKEDQLSLSRKLGHFFLLALTSVVLSVALVSALGPAIEFDDIAYHLVSGKIYIQQHGLKAIPDNPVTFLPKNIEMLFTLGMMLGSEATAKLIHFLLGLLAILATYALGLRFFCRSVALVATGVLVSSPIFLWELRTAHIDAGLALYTFLGLFGVVVWLKSQDSAWFRLAIFFLAFSQGIKYHALFVLFSLAVVLTAICWSRGRNWAQAGRVGLKLILYSCLGLVPWGVVNWVYTGNPLFPLLNNVIPTRYWTPALTQMIMQQQKGAGTPVALDNWTAWGIGFWSMVVEERNRFRGNIGPFFLALLPLTIFCRRLQYPVVLILSFSLLYYLMWLLTGQHVRYLIPLMPGLALVSGFALVRILEMERGMVFRILAHALGCLLGLMAIFNSPFFERYGAAAHYGMGILDTLPVSLLLGEQSKQSYLNRHLPNYPVVEFYNHLPDPKKLLFWWNTRASVYYTNSQATWLFSPLVPQLFSEDPRRIHQLLVNDGITHIIAGQTGQDTHLIVRPEGPFVRHYLKRLFQKNATVLYEVLPEPVEQEFISYDFLSHVAEATVRMTNRPQGKGLVTTLSIQDDQRYVLLTFPPAELEFHLTLGKIPRLKFSIGQYIPRCSGRASFQVWIVLSGQRNKIYERELFAEGRPQDVGWFDEELNLTPYSGQNVGIIFQTRHLGGSRCSWYVWADPVIMCQPPSDR
jgi:hypothetical protein